MPVPFTQFQPSNLRTCWTNGNDLKSSCTTDTYAGGNPTVVTQLKPSIADYATGNLKQGLTNAADTALKESMQPASVAGPGPTNNRLVIGQSGTLRGARAASHPQTFGSILDPNLGLTGQLIYELWHATGTLGVVNFGNAGGEQVQASNTITVDWDNGAFVLVYTWDGGQLRYETASGTLGSYLDARIGQTITTVITVP